MKRWLSYIIPFTKKVSSSHNGILEITWYNGKKHLNTQNTNYSYGSLQRILKTGLRQLNIEGCQHILLLGLGGGCVIETLRKDFDYQNKITAVDIDPTMISITKEEYGLQENEFLELICMDAHEFVSNATSKFDLIIVDIFVDDQVPKLFLERPFWSELVHRFSKQGQLLFNASLNGNSKNLKTIEEILNSNGFHCQWLTKVHGTNTLLLGKK
ncbi:methyltransferase domain-containing protein [Mangrovimonas sp. AS39]|uniref:spermidine synthase n=1 Tax=Mangrovimonas futianensis TaxID=2895523 RepID=UPI001E4D10A5|nr:methyltransferase domain-containing protein [Mangrovimonas futianensis]MCF1190154.1 methyltransferase domain-containing protein [Mangrovimonas futianensis]MCF1194095.1 methyltransferase domain-containing protein [Mangrovimonas futianensis]